MLRVVGIQHDIVWEDRDATLALLTPLIADAAAAGGQLVVLPETFAVGFSMRTEITGEPPDGPTTAWLAAQAETHGIWIGGSVPERAPGDELARNVFVLVAPDGTRHRYAKRHPFSYGGEDEHYAAGDDLLTVDVEGIRCSLAVCYDLRFANQFWDQADDTDAFLVIANWPTAREAHWRALLVARAIENLAYVVGVNRVGTGGDGVQTSGASCIVDPLGVVLADAGAEPGAVMADLDPGVVAATRARFPFLTDRR